MTELQDTPVPASLLSRLAEAADGIRNGQDIWFVARPAPDALTRHDIQGFFETQKDAEDLLLRRNTDGEASYRIFGPFNTSDPDYHPNETVEKVVIHLKRRNAPEDAGTREVVVPGDQYDALFWSMSSVDKFVIPYYVGVDDIPAAARVRSTFANPASIALIHLPGSSYTTDIPPLDQPQSPNHPGLQLLAESDASMGERVQFIPL
jgi:hypothetical protein